MQSNAQQLKLSNWQVHTSMFDVRSSTVDSQGRVWLGTTGGVVIYDIINKDTVLLNHLNGLISSDIRKICSIRAKNYIAGALMSFRINQ